VGFYSTRPDALPACQTDLEMLQDPSPNDGNQAVAIRVGP